MNRELENEIRNSEGEEEASIGAALLNEVSKHLANNGERGWNELDSKLVDAGVDADIRKAIKEGWDKLLDLRDIEWGSFKKHMGARPYGTKEIFGPWDLKYQERREEIFGEGYRADRYDHFYKEKNFQAKPIDLFQGLRPLLIPDLIPQERPGKNPLDKKINYL